jgi:hypothetical protein
MGVGPVRRCCQTGFVWFITVLILIVCAVVINAIKNAEDEIKKEAEGKKLSENEMRTLKIVSGASSIAIYVVNSSLKFVIRRLTVKERHSSITRLNVSVGLKLTMARFINSSLLLLIINFNGATKWFDKAGLVYDATVLMMLMAVTDPILYFLNIPGIIKWLKIYREKSKGDDCTLTQQEGNLLHEGSEIDVANNLSQYFTLIATCFFYAPIIPFALPICFVGSLLNYYVQKYMLLRKHKTPEMLARTLGIFFANLMPFIILIQAVASIVFMQNIAIQFGIE